MDKQKLIEELSRHEFVYKTDAEWCKKNRSNLAAEKAAATASIMRAAIAALSEPAGPELPQDLRPIAWANKSTAHDLTHGKADNVLAVLTTAQCAANTEPLYSRAQITQREAAHAAELAAAKEQGRREALAQVPVGALGVAQCALTAASGEDNLPAADRLQISYALADIAKLLDSARASQENQPEETK